MGSLRHGISVRAIIVSATFVLAILACSHTPATLDGEVVHAVRAGETAWRIAHNYGVPLESLLRANGIQDVHSIPVGMRLRIPNARAAWRTEPAPELAAPRVPATTAPVGIQRVTEVRFDWPVRGRINSGYGRRSGRNHDGVDIKARRGTKVRAAESGRVVESRRFGGYGNRVVVKHVDGYSTVYAHNRRNLVKKGQFVEQGEVIAEVGTTGNSTGAHLHFEIWRGRRSLDPLRYLPAPELASQR